MIKQIILILMGFGLVSCDNTHAIYVLNDTSSEVTLSLKPILHLYNYKNISLKRDSTSNRIVLRLNKNDSLYLGTAIGEVENDLVDYIRISNYKDTVLVQGRKEISNLVELKQGIFVILCSRLFQ